jgi:2-C-methyl-D-erythritol 2,4-cyclodiphosphate synthase
MKFKIGQGYDVHKLAEGYDFWLGGIKIPHHKGAVGHSDADVLIHAICDALLGAANLRDIGYHFSDKDPKYKGIDSKILLKEVVRMLHEKGYQIGNVDSVLALQAPKIGKYVDEMKTILAEIMQITIEDVSIKATTTEELGFVGREEGVEAHAVALIYRAE